MSEPLREKLAALAHEQWSGWMAYLFRKCAPDAAGGVVIPPWAVERWRRQMTTAYADLSENEKDSDRVEADKIQRAAHGRPCRASAVADPNRFRGAQEAMLRPAGRHESDRPSALYDVRNFR